MGPNGLDLLGSDEVALTNRMNRSGLASGLTGRFVWITIGVLAGCQVASPGDHDPAPVFATVLDTLRVRFEGTGRLPMLDATVRPAAQEEYFFESVAASSSLVRAYLWANTEGPRLSPSIAQKLGIPLIDVDSILDADSPGSFDSVSDRLGREVYVVYLTYPGFSPDGSEAVLEYGFGCGSLCGEGHVARLKREGDEWRIVADFLYIIS